ncbi:MAG: hypothetical protein A2942_02010 [Candidatus Lloydbacteria bacterium RIFCSPLOWO2_01_FULL_50_20]|uniref:Uncharacterized protein n=1 Tax=Candidatus Lloydbacteria bacterium RIFCSPLOWO2_01_FULL_50_20 TaxID=1798665 RepID=A0A1G2DJH3_9BACT|nr:MAG: hypothetical protein A3C13_03320 [Candidatus Lloydbacteria bacterium RIFCSPHIGHO2_02_FULL_50_11]OGZ13726.1 MAG: hypothetical protein A2942_02010 [Candidatus Lloydbacteria bacterium RIFCSPLOWO2_01_FULL_50_20]
MQVKPWVELRTVRNPHAREITLPFVAHSGIFKSYEAGKGERNPGEYAELSSDARVIWDDLAL